MTQRMTGPAKKVGGLINLTYALLASQGSANVELQTKRVPVSEDRYVQVTFGYAASDAMRSINARSLQEVRKKLIAAVEARGFVQSTQKLFRDHWTKVEDGVEYTLDIPEVNFNAPFPHFNVQPWVRKRS